LLQKAFDIAEPPPVDRLRGGPRSRADAGPNADRPLRRQPLAEYPAQQQRERFLETVRAA
jgi:hypothetical protein